MEAEPLRNISPSLAEVLRLCKLRVYFGRGGGRAGRSSPVALLGDVAHAVLAAAASGRFEGGADDRFEDAFAAVWDAEVRSRNAALQRVGHAHVSALAALPMYETVRARTKRVARDLSRSTHQEQYVEQRFSMAQGIFLGTPDRVVREGDGLVVEDFKSGAIYEAEGDTPHLREGYRRQVLAYAAMVASELGTWPVRGRIVGLSGEVEEFAVVPEEAMLVVDEALQLLRQFNERLVEVESPDELATPGAEACETCAYQLQCEPFWQAASPYWTRFVSIEGPVMVKQVAQNGMVALQIRSVRGTLEPGTLVVGPFDLRTFPEIESAERGHSVRLAKLRAIARGATPGWYSGVRLI